VYLKKLRKIIVPEAKPKKHSKKTNLLAEGVPIN